MNLQLRGSVRKGRLAASLSAALLVVSLLPVVPVSVVLGATVVGSLTASGPGGVITISADKTSAAGGTSTYTTLDALTIQEAAPNDIAGGTSLILAAPAGFAWKAATGTITVDIVGSPGTPCVSLAASLTVTTSTITAAFTRNNPTNSCLITIASIEVIPTAGSPLVASATIARSGSGGNLPSSGYGTLALGAGAAKKLAFTQQPSTSPSNVAFLTQPKVAIQDAVGNTITSDSASTVTLTLTTPTRGGPGTLAGCTTAVTAVAGIATFSGCRVTGTGVGYRLTATDSTGAGGGHPYTLATSSFFDIPDNLGFETQPGGGAGAGSKAQGGVAFTNQPKVTVRVGTSNFTTNKADNDATTNVTLSIRSGTGTAGAILTCDQAANTLKVTAGSAQFTGCKIDKSGTGYQLVATSVPAYGANAWYSSAFDVVAGPATKLAFTTQPAGAAAGQAFTTQPVVAITDAGGNVVTTGVSANVSLTIGTNPGVPAGVLSCTPGVTVATATSGANAGRAIFAGCKISNAGVGYTLVAIPTNVVGVASLAQGVSTAFTVGAPAAQITLTRSAATIKWGQTVVLSTQFLVNGAGKVFTLQGARDGVTWVTIATLTADSAGRSSFAYRPVTNLYYRVVFAGTSDLQAANSPTVRTVVRQLAILRPTNGGLIRSIARNTSITFTTTVRPARPELAPATVSFSFYRLVGGSYVLNTRRDVLIDAAGQARTTFKFTSVGRWYVRARANPTPYNANSFWSPIERYSVR